MLRGWCYAPLKKSEDAPIFSGRSLIAASSSFLKLEPAVSDALQLFIWDALAPLKQPSVHLQICLDVLKFLPTHIHGGPEVEDAPGDDDIVVAADQACHHCGTITNPSKGGVHLSKINFLKNISHENPQKLPWQGPRYLQSYRPPCTRPWRRPPVTSVQGRARGATRASRPPAASPGTGWWMLLKKHILGFCLARIHRDGDYDFIRLWPK